MTAERRYDLDRALLDPARAFGDPMAVVTAPGLSTGERRRILRRWEHDARELQVAQEENMGGGEADMLDRVLAALRRLEDAASDSPARESRSGS